MINTFLNFLLVMLVVLGSPISRATENDDATARNLLDGLRGMQLPKEKAKIDEANKKMDNAWTFLQSHKTTLRIVKEELEKAVEAEVPDQFFLMDMAYLLMISGEHQAQELAMAAFERIDPKSEVIEANWEELFHLTMRLGATTKNSERYLTQVDRIYLSSEVGLSFFRAPHVVKLTAVDICCMVYGVTGDSAARHLGQILSATGGNQIRVIQLLGAIGSEENVRDVKAVVEVTDNQELLLSGIGFLMDLGGPAGKLAVQTLSVQKMNPATRREFEKMKRRLEKTTFADMAKELTKIDKTKMGDTKLQELLDKTERNNGADTGIPPGALAKSNVPTERLLAQMKRIRARSFRRENNHVFDDLAVTNLLINALQFKEENK